MGRGISLLEPPARQGRPRRAKQRVGINTPRPPPPRAGCGPPGVPACPLPTPGEDPGRRRDLLTHKHGAGEGEEGGTLLLLEEEEEVGV